MCKGYSGAFIATVVISYVLLFSSTLLNMIFSIKASNKAKAFKEPYSQKSIQKKYERLIINLGFEKGNKNKDNYHQELVKTKNTKQKKKIEELIKESGLRELMYDSEEIDEMNDKVNELKGFILAMGIVTFVLMVFIIVLKLMIVQKKSIMMMKTEKMKKTNVVMKKLQWFYYHAMDYFISFSDLVALLALENH